MGIFHSAIGSLAAGNRWQGLPPTFSCPLQFRGLLGLLPLTSNFITGEDEENTNSSPTHTRGLAPHCSQWIAAIGSGRSCFSLFPAQFARQRNTRRLAGIHADGIVRHRYQALRMMGLPCGFAHVSTVTCPPEASLIPPRGRVRKSSYGPVMN